jgi:hypothetical protein
MVFLKSNPEWPLKVFGVGNMLNHVLVLTPDNHIESFPPQCLLQYAYRGLLVWEKKLHISLN